jgi:hypothetical protein
MASFTSFADLRAACLDLPAGRGEIRLGSIASTSWYLPEITA